VQWKPGQSITEIYRLDLIAEAVCRTLERQAGALPRPDLEVKRRFAGPAGTGERDPKHGDDDHGFVPLLIRFRAREGRVGVCGRWAQRLGRGASARCLPLSSTASCLAPDTPIEVWFQDEMRVGQKNKLTYRWARKGLRPRAIHDQRTTGKKPRKTPV
jgi:hypothetical protein